MNVLELKKQSNPQTSLWIKGQYVNLYRPKKDQIALVNTIAEGAGALASARAEMMVSYLVDPDDARVIENLRKEEVEGYFISWIVGGVDAT